MKRWLIAGLTACSLVLLVAACALWYRGRLPLRGTGSPSYGNSPGNLPLPQALSESPSAGRWPTDETAMLGWSPLCWQFLRRLGGSEGYWSITIGLSHWLITMFLHVPITLGLRLLRQNKNQK